MRAERARKLPLGRADGFDQDEAESKRDERAVILCQIDRIQIRPLFACKSDPF
jgi:hypothetical protein